MKILQILPALEVGGVERGVIDLARAMRKLGHETVVISSGGELVGDLQKMGISHYSLPVHQKSFFALSLVPKISQIIQRERIDIVHARSRVPAWIAWFAARQCGKPFVTTCHGYYSKHLLSHIMGWGKRVIVISRVIGRHMIDDFGVSPEKIRLIHRGLDLSQFSFSSTDAVPRETLSAKNLQRLPNLTSPSGRRPVIINVGRLSPIKGQLEFLKAVHLLRHELPHIEVWLVGSEQKGKTKYTAQIQQVIRQFKLESCVKLLGTRRDIPELLKQSDLLVLSTLVPEAFGRVVIEAGAVGTPVLATRVGGVLDIIDHGENGLLVPPGDVEAMAQSMLEMLMNRERARHFSVKLREKVENQFTMDSMVRQTLEVYREVEREKKILIIKLGAMGDLILGTPSLRMVRTRFPEASVSLMVDKKLAPLVSSSPHLDRVIPVNRKRFHEIPYLLKLVKKIRQEGFDLSIDLQNTKWTHLLAALSVIPQRYGFFRGRFGFLLNRPDHSFAVPESPVKHQFRILSKLGIKKLDETLELWPDPAAESRVEELFANMNQPPSEKIVGLAIGSSPQWPSKRWPAQSFKELANRLSEKQCGVVLIGSKEDASLAEAFDADATGKWINLVGKTSLQELISVIKRLDVLVAGDTAPLHVAAAMKTKIVTLFGPTDPKRHMPPESDAIVLTRHLPCQPCYKGECHIEEKNACLNRISVDEVFQAVLKQLEGKEVKEKEAQKQRSKETASNV